MGVEDMGNSDVRLFLWDRQNGMQDLGPVSGHQLTINNAGQISGTMPMDPNSEQAFLWEPGKGGTMLGTLEGKGSLVFGMNNHGQIIGISRSARPSSSAFIWDRTSGMRRLSGPDGIPCFPVSINDAGQVLVYLLERPTLPIRHFLIDPNGPAFLHTVSRRMWPRNINNRSCMAGVEMPTAQTAYLVFWDERKTLQRLVPINVNWMTRLNDRNQIAYTDVRPNRWKELEDQHIRPLFPSEIEEYVSYLWDPARGRVPLNRYVRGMQRFLVADLNNSGCIVGTAEMKDGSTRSVLLEPIPERWGR